MEESFVVIGFYTGKNFNLHDLAYLSHHIPDLEYRNSSYPGWTIRKWLALADWGMSGGRCEEPILFFISYFKGYLYHES